METLSDHMYRQSHAVPPAAYEVPQPAPAYGYYADGGQPQPAAAAAAAAAAGGWQGAAGQPVDQPYGAAPAEQAGAWAPGADQGSGQVRGRSASDAACSRPRIRSRATPTTLPATR